MLLSSLGPGYIIQKPINVAIEPDGCEFIADFLEANISTGGETEEKAIANLQSLITDFYDDLVNVPDIQLGPSLQKTKNVLMEYIRYERT